jgi:hypothetical protein
MTRSQCFKITFQGFLCLLDNQLIINYETSDIHIGKYSNCSLSNKNEAWSARKQCLYIQDKEETHYVACNGVHKQLIELAVS